MSRNALGKGLGALMGGANATAIEPRPGDSQREVSVNVIDRSPFQPRKVFQEEALNELADSIKELGIIQPLIVRQTGQRFELIAGERRWQAATRAGLKQVPVIVRKVGDLEAMEMALVENLQRADLNPIEEADGYARLMEAFKLTQEEVARKVGKSRTAVTNALRLRNLASDVKDMLSGGHLSVGHAKVILGLPQHPQQSAAVRTIIQRGLSVRQTEQLVASMLSDSPASGKKPAKRKPASQSADWRELEKSIQRKLGTKARIVGTAKNGRIEIEYYSGADLERLLDALGVQSD